MSHESIDYLKRMVTVLFQNTLNGRDLDLLHTYLEIAYTRGRLDEFKDPSRRLADPPQGETDARH